MPVVEPLRILQIVTRLNTGGPTHEIAALCRHAPAHGAHTVLAAGRSGPEEGDTFDAIDLGPTRRVRIPGLGRAPGLARDLRATTALLRLILAYRPHVVHTHTSKAGILGRVVAAAAGTPVICHTYHGHAFIGHFGPTVSGLLAAVERWLARRTDALIALGPRGRETLREARIGPRVEVIPPGFDRDRLLALRPGNRREARAALHLEARTTVLLAFGRLAWVKGIDLLLDALARIEVRERDAHLLVAGDGPSRHALERRADALGLGRQVRFLGWRRDAARLFAAADLLVVPSRSEGYPHAVIEAQAAGCPVLGTRVGEMPDLVVEGRTGWLVPPERTEALAERLARLLDDPARLETARRHTAAAAAPAPDEAAFATRTFALYRELLPAAAGASREAVG